MIKERDFVTVLLLSLVTCGIYYLVYIYEITRDMNILAGNDGETTDPSIAVVLDIVTCGIYDYIWVYKQGNRLSRTGEANGLRFNENGTTYLIWDLVGLLTASIVRWYGVYLFIKNFNALANMYNYKTFGAQQVPPPTAY